MAKNTPTLLEYLTHFDGLNDEPTYPSYIDKDRKDWKMRDTGGEFLCEGLEGFAGYFEES